MAERPPYRPKSLFARPRALLVDDRPHRIEMPPPPPIQMAVPEPDVTATQSRRRSLQLPPPPAPLQEDSPPDPGDDDSAVPVAGPARLYIGPPRAVAPVSVRAGLDGRTDISDVSGLEVPSTARSGAREPQAGGEGTEFRFALPRGDRVPARTKGLDRGASTVVATPERRVWVEGQEEPPSREVIRPPSAARPRPGPLEPPLRRPVVSEVIGAPTLPEARPALPAPPPEERDIPHDHPAGEAPSVDLAEDGFYERQGVPSARLPDRALQAPLPPVRTASRKFVPRTPPPRRRVPAWAWALTGAVFVIAGLVGTWSRIQREIERVDAPQDPATAVVVPEETPPGVDTPRVPGGEEEPRVEAPPPAEVPPEVEVAPVATTPVAVPVEVQPPAAKTPVVPPPVATTPAGPPPATPATESSIVLVGALRVVSNVPGKIYINGKYKAAVDEEVVLELPAGVHDVKLVPRRGRAQTQKIRVDAGEARGVVFEIR